MIWTAVLTGAVGCYLLKLAGLSVPDRVLDNAHVKRVAALLPIALLAALAATQTVTDGRDLGFEARLPGVAVAIVAVLLRAPFIAVVAAAAATAALVRLAA